MSYAGWMSFLTARLSDEAVVSPAEAVRFLREFLKLGSQENSGNVLSRARRVLHVKIETDSNEVPAGQARVRLEKVPGVLWDEGEFLLRVGRAGTARSKFLMAHELAHIVLFSLMQHPCVAGKFKEEHEDIPRHESYCRAFARAMILPDHVRRSLVFQAAHEALRAEECQRVESLSKQGGPRLAFEHLRQLAGQHKVSIRAIISLLHRHALLSETESAIVVIRHCANPATGRDADLRVWQAACPQWGFVIPNRRVRRQGFYEAACAYESGQNQQTELRQETLLVKVRAYGDESSHSQKWRDERLPTVCAYTPVDVRDEGRYLVAIWSWPVPDGYGMHATPA